MNPAYAEFEKSDVGQRLAKIACDPQHLYGYRLLSRLGIPAVQAIAWEVKPILQAIEDRRARDFAKQFLGAVVGEQMRKAGFEIAKDQKGRERRGVVPGGEVFSRGAIWRPVEGWPDESEEANFKRGLEAAEKAIQKYRSALAELAK
jgi:hypothetical protein